MFEIEPEEHLALWLETQGDWPGTRITVDHNAQGALGMAVVSIPTTNPHQLRALLVYLNAPADLVAQVTRLKV